MSKLSLDRRFTLLLHSAAIALAVVVPAHAVMAQQRGTVSGRVTDAETGVPVSAATVRAVGTQSVTTTRADGSYRLVLPAGSYDLRATFIGYGAGQQTVVVPAGASVGRDFSLRQTGISLDQIVVTGSRRTDRTVVDAPVPIDVLSSEDIQRTGLTETSEIIQMLAPSFNFPRPSVNDGTDHIRPATLRGLGPDQVLVLINGKRRHNTALVHVNQSVGRGSTSVDFNAIPANSIDRIEILRDGSIRLRRDRGRDQHHSQVRRGRVSVDDCRKTILEHLGLHDRCQQRGHLRKEGLPRRPRFPARREPGMGAA